MKLQRPDDKGFTIIEIMIVLAIAGLILVIVFLAVPSLQRQNRNQQRKHDLARISTLMDEFAQGNGNRYPSPADIPAFDDMVANDNLISPDTGNPYPVLVNLGGYSTHCDDYFYDQSSTGYVAITYLGPAGTTTASSYVLSTRLEGDKTACVGNSTSSDRG